MTNTPDRSSGTTFLSNFDIFLVANRKGGIGKTTIILFLMACALMRKASVQAFEIDRQSRLERMYPGLVQQIDLPDTEKLVDDELSEGRALAPVYHAFRSPSEKGLVFVDIGANYDERVAHGLLRARMGDKIEAAGRRACVLVPLDQASDTIVAAASAVRHFTTALPEARVVFVQRQAELAIETGPRSLLSEAARKAWTDVIEPLHSPDSVINIGQMRKGVHQAFVGLGKNPAEFMDSDPKQLGAAAAGSPGDPLEDEYAGWEVLAHFEEFIGKIGKEAQRVLGFRTGTDKAQKATQGDSLPS